MSWQRKRSKKRALAKRDGGYFCAYCGRPGTNRELTIDHVVPRAKGGHGLRSNLVLACRNCNEIKADDPAPVVLLEETP